MGYSINNRQYSVGRRLFQLRGSLAKQNAYKIKKLQNEVFHGEIHRRSEANSDSITLGGGFLYVDMTNIAQGDAINQRTGHRITIRGVKVNIHRQGQQLDCWLVISPNGDTPIAADFHNVVGGYLTDTAMGSHKILQHLRNYQGANNYTTLNRKFKKGIDVRWNSSTSSDVSKNRIGLVFSNHYTTDLNIDYSFILYWTDK